MAGAGGPRVSSLGQACPAKKAGGGRGAQAGAGTPGEGGGQLPDPAGGAPGWAEPQVAGGGSPGEGEGRQKVEGRGGASVRGPEERAAPVHSGQTLP